jgi:hypothetical protein
VIVVCVSTGLRAHVPLAQRARIDDLGGSAAGIVEVILSSVTETVLTFPPRCDSRPATAWR